MVETDESTSHQHFRIRSFYVEKFRFRQGKKKKKNFGGLWDSPLNHCRWIGGNRMDHWGASPSLLTVSLVAVLSRRALRERSRLSPVIRGWRGQSCPSSGSRMSTTSLQGMNLILLTQRIQSPLLLCLRKEHTVGPRGKWFQCAPEASRTTTDMMYLVL